MPGIFNQPLDLRHLPKNGRLFEVAASDAECRELEDRLAVRAVSNAKMSYLVESLGSRAGLQVSGSISADIVQPCIISLADVPSHLSETFSVRFVDEQHIDAVRPEDMDPDEEDVETFSGDFLDVSEVLVQYMALAIDQYPRANSVSEDEEFSYYSGSGSKDDVEEKPHPFAELKKLQDKT
jgi:uncharacterized metal-binding protein YceD (DUF177 family)